jgi:hypothetical protein
VGCGWALALVRCSANELLLQLQLVALLQVIAQVATQGALLHDEQAAATAAASLLPVLEPCIQELTAALACGAGAALQAQASLAMQSLLRVPGPHVAYACLRELLSCEHRATHPELAALLIQELRQQLAATVECSNAALSDVDCMRLVLPWLRQSGAAGWHDQEQLALRSNALSAALAVVRLVLLRAARQPVVGDGGDRMQHQRPPAFDDDAAGDRNVTELLREPLAALAAAAQAALAEFQQETRGTAVERVLPMAAITAARGVPDARLRFSGDACGSGGAVDAWLAVSRLQDVLQRVLELLPA